MPIFGPLFRLLKENMMKYLICILLLLTGLRAQAQDMKSLFVNLPDSLSLLLTKVNRADFGDFLANGMKAEVKNRFGQTSEMLRLTDDYLLLQESEVSTVEMKLLPVNDSVKVICTVHTCLGPAADSHVAFYSTRWERLPADHYLRLPAEEDFYLNTLADSDSLQELRRQADLYLKRASLADSTATLRFSYTTPDYQNKETAQALRRYLKKEPLRYDWKDGHFVPTLTPELKLVTADEWYPHAIRQHQ